uniref:GH92 family glycosyl hydrolase n=1 Tax=uncultured Draconibacterium sp. TaxID=1573823 RepID=UPI0032168564
MKDNKMLCIRFLIIVLITILLGSCSKKVEYDYTLLVNPFVGTIGSGNTFQGPVLPYGMIQPGPYASYADDMENGTMYGFCQTHLSGMAGGGVAARGNILFMPATESEPFQQGVPNNYSSKFLHSNEEAAPGYYKVKLDDKNITVELSATTRAGIHRYSFPDSENNGVYLNLQNGFLTVNSDGISGCNNNRVWFYARFDQPIKVFEAVSDGRMQSTSDTIRGENITGYFRFENGSKPVQLKVAISPVSVEGARKNLDAEIPGWDFERVKADAKKAWNRELNKIQVEGGSKTERILFYTAFYHSLIHPNIYMDVDKKYRSTNGKVYIAEDFNHYTNFSLWDTFRALHPLYTIINTKQTTDFIRTFLERYDHTGRMLIMEFEGNEGSTPPMIGVHSLSVIADAYAKGIRNYDVQKAYEAMKKLANDNVRPTREHYLNYVYIPADLKGQSVSRTLEFAYDDWCMTCLAKDFSKEDDLYFSQRADFYKNVFSSEVNFMRGRKSNFQFVENFDPMETINHYTEANAYQYSTYVPQDVEGLINLMGGDKMMENWLDSCFSVQTDFSKINLRDVTGLIGQYAHGNEPSHHIAYLYNYVGTPWKTQQMTRKILSTLYKNTSDGIDGNEDCGQMSAWYVLSAMGFYAVTPGMDYYVIGSPLFNKVTINLENGKKFEIIANNNNGENMYIQSALLNGEAYSKSFLKHEDIMNGGQIIFEMGNTPNNEWGVNKEDRPYSPEKRFSYAEVPNIEFEDILFLNSRTVTLSEKEPGTKIYYTLDGTVPSEKSILYTKPIVITKSTELKTIACVEGKYPSYPISIQFKQIEMLDAVNASELKPGIKYLYREGKGVICAKDQKTAPVLDTGILKTFNVDAVKDDRSFGYNFEGYIKVPATGVYTFWLEANDGAVLYLNDKLIIDNDGGHRAQILDSKIGLKKGWHPIKLDYFQQGLAKSLVLEWEGPGIIKQEVAAKFLYQ